MAFLYAIQKIVTIIVVQTNQIVFANSSILYQKLTSCKLATAQQQHSTAQHSNK